MGAPTQGFNRTVCFVFSLGWDVAQAHPNANSPLPELNGFGALLPTMTASPDEEVGVEVAAEQAEKWAIVKDVNWGEVGTAVITAALSTFVLLQISKKRG